MKTLILTAFLIMTASASSQSVLTLGAGTSMGVLTGANLCANVINGSGLLYGGGTICGGLVSVEPITSNELPTSFEMFQNYPNPFNPVTKIQYQLPKANYVSIKLFDQLGKETAILFEGEQQAGYYQVTVEGRNLASGIYYCRLNAADYQKVIKMSLIK
ncbi:MAG: T9SS type A sorting domain-containing protein [Ignavibacteria bacterium]